MLFCIQTICLIFNTFSIFYQFSILSILYQYNNLQTNYFYIYSFFHFTWFIFTANCVMNASTNIISGSLLLQLPWHYKSSIFFMNLLTPSVCRFATFILYTRAVWATVSRNPLSRVRDITMHAIESSCSYTFLLTFIDGFVALNCFG